MSIFSGYREVLSPDGSRLSVRQALEMINGAVDAVLAEEDIGFDSETQWAVTWYEECGFVAGKFGRAELLARAKNTSVDGVSESGIIESGRGQVRLLRPAELNSEWNPQQDPRRTVWEMTHHLIHRLETGGETLAGQLVQQIGGDAPLALDLAYRLYRISDLKGRPQDARHYNHLVQSWSGIEQQSRDHDGGAQQTELTGVFTQ